FLVRSLVASAIIETALVPSPWRRRQRLQGSACDQSYERLCDQPRFRAYFLQTSAQRPRKEPAQWGIRSPTRPPPSGPPSSEFRRTGKPVLRLESRARKRQRRRPRLCRHCAASARRRNCDCSLDAVRSRGCRKQKKKCFERTCRRRRPIEASAALPNQPALQKRRK